MQIQINPPKAYTDLGYTTALTIDTDRINEGGFAYLLKQGLRYTASARTSHAFAKMREDGQTPTADDAAAIAARLLADLNAPEWPERERAEREPVSLEARCWEEVLEPVFKTVGWLVTGRKAKPAEGDKPAVEAREAVTARSILAANEPEEAYRAANRDYLVALRERDGKPVDDEFLASVARRSDEGWAKKLKAHRELLRARQKAAAEVSAEEGAL
jgi:hypothetical protein